MGSKGHDTWFIPRPKRSLKSVPEILRAFSAIAYGKRWSGNRALHIEFEDQLQIEGIKRMGARLDASGSGGRTYAAMLYALGLWFEYDNRVHLTLAGQAILRGESFTRILTKQVLSFQYPSPYSKAIGINPRFKLRPFRLILKLLMHWPNMTISERDIARVLIHKAESDTDEAVMDMNAKVIVDEVGHSFEPADRRELDIANTFVNWLDITGLTVRQRDTIRIADEKLDEVQRLLAEEPPMISMDKGDVIFQQRYGLDLVHEKDTRNLLKSSNVIWTTIEQNRILRSFDIYASEKLIAKIDSNVVCVVAYMSGAPIDKVAQILEKRYPHGTFDSFFLGYRQMAFSGRENATAFEIATNELYSTIFGYESDHLGQGGAHSVPDVIPYSHKYEYCGVIDTKAYANYSITGDHHNRMVHNYIEKAGTYTRYPYSVEFFQYVAGGFCNTINQQLSKIAYESGVRGSAISVYTMQDLVQMAIKQPINHIRLRKLFSCGHLIGANDIASLHSFLYQ